jgi:hypothetical protein
MPATLFVNQDQMGRNQILKSHITWLYFHSPFHLGKSITELMNILSDLKSVQFVRSKFGPQIKKFSSLTISPLSISLCTTRVAPRAY